MGPRFVMPLALFAVLCLASCSSSSTASRPSSATSTATTSVAAPASVAALTPYFGSYVTADQDLMVVARMGWFFDRRTSAYRTIYATAKPDRFSIGPSFEVAQPKFADLLFGAGTLQVVEAAGSVTASRIDYKQTDVMVPANGSQLAATITEPPGAGPHPGIVIVHGAEPGVRAFYDFWVGLYTSLGLAVLTYDKRGLGASTGTYPGEFPSPAALDIYADDAAAALQFLSHWQGVDPKHVGFHGGSQGGWTVPLAMQRHPGTAFAVLVSAPATTVGQTDLWAGFTSGGEVPPTESTDQMLDQVRSAHSGYDPKPALKELDKPTLWLLGTNDQTVPTAVCVEILESLHKPNFTIVQLPAGHAMLLNSTGLLADDALSPGLAPSLVPTISGWIGPVVAGS